MKRIVLVALFSLSLINTFAQAAITPTTGWVDPALNHNRLIREQTGEGAYKLVGPYKVIGTSYLFGERNKGNLYSAEATAINIQLGYNTYNQELEFLSGENINKPLVKMPGEVDSFVFLANRSVGLSQDQRFIYGKYLGSNEKAYFQQVATGPKMGIYKRYKSDVGYVSSNYVQSELRQFDLLFDYFLYNATTKTIKKLKNNVGNIQKELNAFGDVSSVFTGDSFSANPEEAIRKAVLYIHQ
ncbi:MAG: hypothetical protein ACKO6Q_06990 [Bacteroidota bacterium]